MDCTPYNVRAPSLPLPTPEYNQSQQDQFQYALRLYFNRLDNYLTELSACINTLKYKENKIHLLNMQLDEVSDGGFHNKGHSFPFQSDPI